MKQYTGDTPCPGCGKSGTVNPRPYKGKVCYECKDAISSHKRWKEYIEADRQIAEWSYVRYAGPYANQIGPNPAPTLLKKYRPALAKAIGKMFSQWLSDNGIPWHERQPHHNIVEELSFGMTTHGVRHDVIIPKRDMDAFFQLAKILEEGWEEEVGDTQAKVDAAFQQGQNLLLSLNKSPNLVESINAKSVE